MNEANNLLANLPHRYPILLVDKVIEFESHKRIVALKNVTINEEFFSGHFPSEPIMPGMLVLEALAQAACILVINSYGIPGQPAYVTGADDVAWRRKVVPGDQLRLKIDLEKFRNGFGRVNARATVDGEVAAIGVFKFFLPINKPEVANVSAGQAVCIESI